MKSTPNAKVVKGIIFAGCSFTWGQGLYYYSNLPTLAEPLPDHYDRQLVKDSHIKFMESVRYPRIVANHFNTFEYVHPENGGSNQGAVQWWRTAFMNKNRDAKVNNMSVPQIDYSEISHVVFQLTQWQRDNFKFTQNGQNFDIPFHNTHHYEVRDHFFNWLADQKISLGTWVQQYIEGGLANVKSLLQDVESQGIKTTLFTWPHEYIPYIEKDPWLKERLMTLEYKGITYQSVEDLMSTGTMQNKGYNPELTIKWDEESFEITPKDHHPSLKCHQVMAENVIRHIESRA